jgi:hypothetical protein
MFTFAGQHILYDIDIIHETRSRPSPFALHRALSVVSDRCIKMTEGVKVVATVNC